MSNALQVRDASDVTALKKQRGTIQTYNQLRGKDLMPIGGISHSDLMDVARYGATYIPAASRFATVVTISGVQTLIYQTAEIAKSPCFSCSAASYQTLQFPLQFRQQ